MDVLSDVRWRVVINYMLNVFNIDSSSDDVRADEDVSMSVSKGIETLFTLFLRFLTMNQGHALAGTSQVLV